jgi:hypothetical protein
VTDSEPSALVYALAMLLAAEASKEPTVNLDEIVEVLREIRDAIRQLEKTLQ